VEPGVSRGEKKPVSWEQYKRIALFAYISQKSAISLLVTIMRTAGMNFDNPAVKNTVDQTVFIIYVSAPITGQVFPQRFRRLFPHCRFFLCL
jgi:hypothetical protein